MGTISRHSETCMVKIANNSKMTEAVVSDFEEHVKLNVVVNKAIKISMRWNGKTYEGRAAGMDFESNGPTVMRSQTGIRG